MRVEALCCFLLFSLAACDVDPDHPLDPAADQRATSCPPHCEPNSMINSPAFKPQDENAWTQLFQNWTREMRKSYRTPADERKAFDAFKTAGQRIMQHNGEQKAGRQSYMIGFHKYSDLTHDEFMRTRLGLKPPSWWNPATMPPTPSTTRPTPPTMSPIVTTTTPRTTTSTPVKSLNYTAQGCVAPVKDQMQCGSCWAFGSIGAIESAYCRRMAQMGRLVQLSEQQLVDCDINTGSVGCGGGWPMTVYDYVKTQGGLNTEMQYMYVAGLQGKGMTCMANKTGYIPMTLSYANLAPNDAALMTALETVGPLSVGVAVGSGFEGYMSGVMDPRTACISGINHVVLLVGYGVDTQTGLPYWLGKNSWGTSWGENGYFRLNRAIPNSCLITQLAASVVVAPGKATIEVNSAITLQAQSALCFLLALCAVYRSYQA